MYVLVFNFFFFQAEDGIRDLVRSRGLGDVYKRQERRGAVQPGCATVARRVRGRRGPLDVAARTTRGLSLIHI